MVVRVLFVGQRTNGRLSCGAWIKIDGPEGLDVLGPTAGSPIDLCQYLPPLRLCMSVALLDSAHWGANQPDALLGLFDWFEPSDSQDVDQRCARGPAVLQTVPAP